MDLNRYVGERIRDLRNRHGGPNGISQEALAKALGTAANTVSRWETGTYKPSLEDLDALGRFFGVSILAFLPHEADPADAKVSALLRAARDLPEDDIDELQKYAEYRRARALMGASSAKKKAGRPRAQP
ncbi:MAG: helix-turn-helix transcriptional regulator [Phycisphaerales bacterium]|nr:helix-turn-helix transcriptional regulator [Phycisphaerales bacterium]